MDQKFISGNFLPPPRGYPHIALLNNGHPAVKTSLLLFISARQLLKRPPIEILLPFPSVKVGQLEGEREEGGEGTPRSFINPPSQAHQGPY